MTWEEFAAARLLLAEETLGGPLRAAQRSEQAREDAEFENTKAALKARQQAMVT